MKDDILFVFTVDPDTQKLQDALEKMGDLLDENVDIAAKEMQKALDAHVVSLEKINKLMDPTAMRERIRMEMELVEARKDLARMEEDERNSGKYKNAAYLDELTRLNKAMNPEGMRERIQMELTLVEKHKTLAEAEQRVAMAQRYANGSAQKDLHESLRQQALGMVSSGAQGGQLSALGSTLGSFAGGAIGGPAGAEVGKALGEAAAREIPKMLAGPSSKVVGGLRLMGNSLNDLNSQLGPVSMGFNLIGDVLDGIGDKVKSIPIVGELLGPIFDNLAAVPRILNQITGSLTSMAGVASPGQARMFQMVVEDIQGVIGERFLPVLELMRDGMRLFGDVLQNLLPSGREVRSVLSGLREVLAEMGDDIRDMVTRMGPAIRGTLTTGLRLLTTGLTGLATAATYALRGIEPLIGGLEALGLIGEGEFRSSTGAAARQASFSGVMDYQRQLQISSYTQPGMPTSRDVPSLVSDIRGGVMTLARELNVTNIVNAVRAVITSPESATEGVAAGFDVGTSSAASALGGAGSSILNALRLLGL